MAKSKKRDLSEGEAKQALTFKNMKWSLGKIARYFGVNKPTILKALDMWDSKEQTDSIGRKYIIKRGKVYITHSPITEDLKKKISGAKAQRLKRRNSLKKEEVK